MLYYFPPFIILNKTFSLQLLNSYELIPSSIRQKSKIGKKQILIRDNYSTPFPYRLDKSRSVKSRKSIRISIISTHKRENLKISSVHSSHSLRNLDSIRIKWETTRSGLVSFGRGTPVRSPCKWHYPLCYRNASAFMY